MALRTKRLTLLMVVISSILVLSVIGSRYVLGAWYPFMYIPVALLVGILGALTYMHRQVIVRFLVHKSTKKSVSSGLLLIYLLVALLVINYLAVKYPVIVDMTRTQKLSLAPESKSLLSKIRSHYNVLVFYRGSQDQVKVSQLQRLFNLAKAESPMAGQIQSLDIYKNFEQVRKLLGPQQKRQFDTIVAFVECNGKNIAIDHPHSEVEFVQAINQCFIRRKRTLGVIASHGEWQVTSKGELYEASRVLGDLQIDIQEMSLLRSHKIENIDALMIVGPRADYLENELTAIETYLDSGGKVFITLDPDKKTNLNQLIQKYSIRSNNDYVLKLSGTSGSSSLEVKDFNGQNSIVKTLEGGTLLFELATTLSQVKGEKDWQVDNLAYSGADSFVVEEIGNQQIEPEFKSHLVAAESSTGSGGQLIVVGDSDWLLDQWFPVFYNKHFFINIISELLDDKSLTVLPRHTIKNEPIFFARMQLAGFFALCLLIPFMILLGSIIVWWRGRN
ncbi:MAG: Gldg family protein [Bdellovibrionales bacterium]